MFGLFNKRKKIEEKKKTITDLTFKDFILPSKLKVTQNYIYSSNGTYISYVIVKGFPKMTSYYSLLSRVGKLKGIKILIDTKELSLSQFEKSLNDTDNNMRDNVKKKTELIKYENLEQQQQAFMDQLYQENFKTYKGSILIKIVGQSQEDLLKKRMTVSSALKSISVVADELPELQYDCYLSSMPFNSNKVAKYGEFPFSAYNLANLWIPSYNSFKTSKGYPIGVINDGGLFCFDLFERVETDSSNSNFYIVGKSGQGKSYLLKKIILNEVMNGVNAIILDMQDEYIDLINNVGGVLLDIPRVNVLQVVDKGNKFFKELAELNHQEKQLDSFSHHLSFLRNWYKTYNRTEILNKEDKCFEDLCLSVYKDFNINQNTNFSKLDNTDYPRLIDVYHKALELIEKQELSLWTQEQLKSVAQSLSTAVQGSDEMYFNCYTETHSFYDEQTILCFRLTEMKKLNQETRNALYLALNNYISSLILSDKESKWLYLWDEFHLAIDGSVNADNYAVREFATMFNIARKFEVSVGFASTSLNNLGLDSIKEYTSAMLSQASFKFIFKTVDNDFKTLSKLLSNLNDVEERIIQTQAKRTCLVSLDKRRFQVKIEGVDLSNLTGEENPYLLQESLIFGKSGGR